MKVPLKPSSCKCPNGGPCVASCDPCAAHGWLKPKAPCGARDKVKLGDQDPQGNAFVLVHHNFAVSVEAAAPPWLWLYAVKADGSLGKLMGSLGPTDTLGLWRELRRHLPIKSENDVPSGVSP